MRTLLTLIVPLLDRHSLTHRVLSNLDKQKCEFKIIVADGSEEPFPEELLDSYLNLRIEYFYSGYDVDIEQYIHKMSTAINKVYTPFCMLFDNDDLIDLNGIRNGVAFLSKNKEYSCYQNDVRVLECNPKFSLGDSLYTHDSIEQNNAMERIKKSIYNFNSFNYAVLRTPVIRCLLDSMSSFNIGDFQFFQKGLACFAALFGKCKRLHNESYYYFIPGNSIIQNSGRVHKFSNWCDTMYWPQSAVYLASFISRLHEEMYMLTVRDEFIRFFVKEVHKKNNLPAPTEKEMTDMSEHSRAFDECIEEHLGRTCQELRNSIWYSRALSPPSKACHKEFVKSLNT